MFVVGIVGTVRGQEIEDNAEIMTTWKIKDISLIILISGAGGVGASICGFVGSVKHIPNLLKLFIGLIFLTCIIQIAMGIYMNTLNLDDQEEMWFEATSEGYANRVQFQDYFECCGWNTYTDSVPPPQSTLCPVTRDQTCSQAAQTFLDDEVLPIAFAALIIALIEAVALTSACFLIMRKGETVFEDAFHY